MARQMVGQLHPWREDQARRVDASRPGLPAQVLGRPIVVAQQPEDAPRHGFEKAHPDIEERRRQLVVVVEAAEYECPLRQPAFLTRWRASRNLSLRVVDLIAFGQVNQPFREVRLLVERHHERIDDGVIYEIRAHGSGISEVADLYRRGPMAQYPRAGVSGMALQVDSDVDFFHSN